MFTKTDIDNYFLSYKHEHLFLILLAAAALAVAASFYFIIKKQFYKGIAIALVSFAVLFFSTSLSEYKRADRLRVVNTYSYDLHPEYLKGKEMNRISMVKKNITMALYVCMTIALLAIVLYFYASKKLSAPYLRGVAVGAFIMGTIAAITFNVIRINLEKYEKGIIAFTKEIIV